MAILITGSKGQLGSEIEVIHGQYEDVDFVFADITELDITKLEDVLSFVKKILLLESSIVLPTLQLTRLSKREN